MATTIAESPLRKSFQLSASRNSSSTFKRQCLKGMTPPELFKMLAQESTEKEKEEKTKKA